jgi:5-formyltetrahydrofolate cyclo-ligase
MSLAIANNLLPIWIKLIFMCFLPITEQNEVDTELILHLLSGKTKDSHFKIKF